MNIKKLLLVLMTFALYDGDVHAQDATNHVSEAFHRYLLWEFDRNLNVWTNDSTRSGLYDMCRRVYLNEKYPHGIGTLTKRYATRPDGLSELPDNLNF